MLKLDMDQVALAITVAAKELPTIIKMTVFEYFATPGMNRPQRKHERAAINRNGTLTLHELMMAVMENRKGFKEDFELLAEMPRNPSDSLAVNHLELLYRLYDAVTGPLYYRPS